MSRATGCALFLVSAALPAAARGPCVANEPYHMRVEANPETVVTVPGAVFQLRVFLRSDPEPIEGFGVRMNFRRWTSVGSPFAVRAGADVPPDWSFRGGIRPVGSSFEVGALGAGSTLEGQPVNPMPAGEDLEILVVDVAAVVQPAPLSVTVSPIYCSATGEDRDGDFSFSFFARTHVVTGGQDYLPCTTEYNLGTCTIPAPNLLAVDTSLALTLVTGANFRRGDCNQNGLVSGVVGDLVFLLRHLFLAREPPACEDACDANNDEAVNVADAVYLVDWIFRNGPAPPDPGPSACGPDPDLDPTLGCGPERFCP